MIKTRIQNKNFENPEGGFKIVGNMMKNEGISSFFKGLTPKVSLLCVINNTITNEYLASYDRTKASFLFLASPDTDPGV